MLQRKKQSAVSSSHWRLYHILQCNENSGIEIRGIFSPTGIYFHTHFSFETLLEWHFHIQMRSLHHRMAKHNFIKPIKCTAPTFTSLLWNSFHFGSANHIRLLEEKRCGSLVTNSLSLSLSFRTLIQVIWNSKYLFNMWNAQVSGEIKRNRAEASAL